MKIRQILSVFGKIQGRRKLGGRQLHLDKVYHALLAFALRHAGDVV